MVKIYNESFNHIKKVLPQIKGFIIDFSFIKSKDKEYILNKNMKLNLCFYISFNNVRYIIIIICAIYSFRNLHFFDYIDLINNNNNIIIFDKFFLYYFYL